jgi:hypothetical protein
MNLLVAALIVVCASAVGIAALLLIRRRAPDGGYFNDGDRAAGVFGVLATGFAVLLGFVVFLAFTNYDQSRSGAEREALLLVQQFETAQFLPEDVREEISGAIACYGRYVVHTEWPRMENGEDTDMINPWSIELFRLLTAVEPELSSEETAFAKWLDQTSDREVARTDRVHGAEGVIPITLWVAIFFAAIVIVIYMLFFADSGERALVQALLIGSVVAVVVATLIAIRFLNEPYHSGPGGIRPVAMERSLDILDEAFAVVGLAQNPPCDEDGLATQALAPQ